ncbi:MAG: hypothetical protein IIX60_04560, partial [Clostridia bacterium]|nr:hypothetical protein [Clostridia bacterium]
EQGKTYIVSFDVKAIKGATVNTSNAIIYGTSANPSTSNGAANTNNITVLSASGFTLEYKVNGVAQKAGTVLSVDSDWQTATVTFTAKAAGKFGICTKLSGTDIYIDNVKIYDHDAYYDSKFQNRLTFDNGGLGVNRYVNNFAIGTENGNGYCIVEDTVGSAYFASCENSAVYRVSGGEYKTATGLGTVANAHKKMFKFESGHSYEVTFKYRYDSTATEKANTALVLRLMADPAGADHVADDLLGTNSWAKDIVCSDISTPNQLGLGVWQEVKVTFTVKTKDETSGYAKIRPSSSGDVSATHPDEYNLTIDKTGAYFGIKCIGQRVHIDDYNVRELVNYQVIYLETTNVSHDMEQDELATNSSGSIGSHFMRNDNKGATFTDSKDGHGKVLEFDANGSRGTFGDSNVFVRGKKYYISFDAKSTDGASKYMWLIFANLANNSNNHTGSQGTPRYILSNKDGGNNGTFSTVSNMFEFYINGQSVTKANFKISGEWQHFGMIVDFTNEALNTEFATNHTNGTGFFNEAKYFYFGISNSQYDNFKITSVDAMPDAVPTSDISYVSKEISHDMETYGGFNEVEEGTAHIVNSHDKKYGQVLEITKAEKARIGFTDSNIITAGKKYYISFDAKTTNKTSRYMWLMVCTTSTTKSPRFIISDTTHDATPKASNPDDCKGATSISVAENGNAFRYYIDGKEVHRDEFKLSGDWRKYTLVIDTSDPELIAKSNANSGEIKNLLSGDAKYFYFGTDNAWFDNFRMVEVSEATSTVSSKKSIYDTEVSCREESTTANGDYVSAGLRFKSKLPNGIVAEADEIGFVAAPSSLAKKTTDWYKLENGVNQVARTAIVKDDIRNYVYATDGDNTYYQLVFTGLSDENGKTAYNRRFSAVMYTKLGNEYKYYPLGEASYYQVGGITHVFNFDEKSLDVGTIASLDYKIVYNAEDYTSWVLKNQIDKLKQTMNNKGFGIEELDLRADTTLDAGDYEIVIGNTNRGTVGDASVTKNTNRYAIRIAGSKIYVLGGSTYALQSAVYELETMILAGKITEKEGSYLDTAIINATSEYKLVWQSEFDDPNTITYDSNNMASIKNWWVDPITVNTTNTSLIAGSQAFAVSDSETVRWDEKGYLILRATRKDN